MNENRALGQAGEYRVASELLKRGINVFFPAVDTGVDIITEHGLKIQVKTSNQEYSNTRGYKYPAYLFSTRKKKYVSSKGKTLRPRIKEGEVDFVVFWCVSHDWFFIIPDKEVSKTQLNIMVEPVENNTSKYMPNLNSWHLLEKRSVTNGTIWFKR